MDENKIKYVYEKRQYAIVFFGSCYYTAGFHSTCIEKYFVDTGAVSIESDIADETVDWEERYTDGLTLLNKLANGENDGFVDVSKIETFIPLYAEVQEGRLIIFNESILDENEKIRKQLFDYSVEENMSLWLTNYNYLTPYVYEENIA